MRRIQEELTDLRKEEVVDNRGYDVTYENYEGLTWGYCKVHFKTEDDVLKFLGDIKTDFNTRVVQIEKRVQIYQKYVR